MTGVLAVRIRHIIFVIALLFLTACTKDTIERNMAHEVQAFEFKNQNDETVSLDDLKGTWWIADFMYTNCHLVCPRMTNNLLKVQDRLKEENISRKVELISFTVDPEFDKPEVLQAYAENYQIDLDNWSFLTGYDLETIKDLSMNSFQTVLQEASPENPNELIAHGTYFFLVNPEGTIIKKYDGLGPKDIDILLEDLKMLLR